MNKKIIGTVCSILLSLSLGQVAQGVTGAFDEHYNLAQNYLLQNQYSSSIVEFRKALRINYLDNSARIGLINAYLARATYYANQEKSFDKAANDFRSALFYLKMYPEKEQTVQNSAGVISSASENLNQCLKVMNFDTTASSRFKRAEELRAMGNFSAAAYEFYKASQNDTLKSNANEQIADLMKLLGNEPRSVEYYKIALNGKSSDSLLKMKYARTLDKLGNYDEAVIQYNDALANSKGDMEVLYALERIYKKKLAETPNDAELNANIGAIKQAQGDFDAALSYYAKAEQINPSNVNTRLNVGTLFQQKKQYQKAIQSYDSVLTLYPSNTQALLYKAQALKEMGDSKTAMMYYKQVIDLEPSNIIAKSDMAALLKDTMSPREYVNYLAQTNNPNDLYDFAYKLHKENKIDDAIFAYRTYISKDLSNANAYTNLAVCYASKEDYVNAKKVLNEAKNKFPNNSEITKTLKEVEQDDSSTKLATAVASYNNKNYKQAIQDYLAITPTTEDSLLGVAASYQALNDYNNAIEYYKRAEKIAPNNPEIPYYIGYLYSEQQNWDLSKTYLQKAVKLNPNSEAKELLAYVNQSGSISVLNDAIALYDKNDFANALTKFNEVLKNESNNAYAYYYRALIYDDKKQTKLAINDYLNVLKYSNEFPIVNYMLAVDYDSLENYKEAFKYYNKFIAAYTTDDEYLKYAKSRRDELKPYAS